MCHIQLANYIHENYSDVKIGGMLAYQQIYSATSKPEDIWAAKQVQEFLNFNIYDADTGRSYSPEVMQYAKNHHINMDITDEDKEIMKKAKADFLAFSYYSSWVLSSDKIPAGEAPNRYLNQGGVEAKYVKTNDWGWAIDPLGFRNAITTMYNYYRIPIFPIENGIGLKESLPENATPDTVIEDPKRIDYVKKYLSAMADAIHDGANVKGYFIWSLMDVFSWSNGYEKRYGLFYVDFETQERYPKKSAHWYKKVAESQVIE